MELLSPKNINEAFKFLKEHPDCKIIAGGTDLNVLINSGALKVNTLVNIWGLNEFRGIKEDGNYIKIGAMMTHTEIIQDPLIKKYLPLLAKACVTIGARQIQNRGTIGGNVANASPAGDALPVLLAYETEVELAGITGVRWIRFADFYTGYRSTAMNVSELITRFRIKKAGADEMGAFEKVGTRRAQAISKVCACYRMALKGKKIISISIAYGSVAAVPVRLYKIENFLTGRELSDSLTESATEMAKNEVTPIDDIRSTKDYRRHLCGVLLARFLKTALP